MKRIKMTLAYQGTQYYGWQAQKAALPSVQQAVEKALSQLADHPIHIQCAGRTDKGVHATGQVIHFDTFAEREIFQWVEGANFFLPKDIRMLKAEIVSEEFHARFSAVGRIYHYVIYNYFHESPFLGDITTWQRKTLNIEGMERAAKRLIGEHDFSAFRGRDCQAHSPIKTMYDISFQAEQPPVFRSSVQAQVVTPASFITIKFHANAFLHHMVRNIVGSLLEIGLSKKNPEWLEEVLVSRDRRRAAAMAPPNGLYLMEVLYPM